MVARIANNAKRNMSVSSVAVNKSKSSLCSAFHPLSIVHYPKLPYIIPNPHGMLVAIWYRSKGNAEAALPSHNAESVGHSRKPKTRRSQAA